MSEHVKGNAMKWLDQPRDAYLLGLVRCVLSGLLLLFVWHRFAELESWAFFGDVFHMPMVPEAWVPSRGVYEVLLALAGAGALLGVVGFHGREGLFVAASIGLYVMACDRLQYHNNRFALLLCCFLTAFAASDRSFLLYRGRRHALPVEERLAPTLPVRLLQLQVSVVYLSSGGGKLLDPDWRGGVSMLTRFQEGFERAAERGRHFPDWYREVMSSPLTTSIACKGAIALELFLAIGLWLPRTRAVALWAGAIFHIGIQISASVEFFSYLMGVAYIAFVTPELRERRVLIDPSTAVGRRVAAALPKLDWLARFRVEPVTAPAGGPLVVIDRNGAEFSGGAVWGALARGLPAFYLAWPVLALLKRGRPRLTDP